MPYTSALHRFSMVLVAGGLAWLAKMAVITASDGAAGGTAEAVAGVFYLLGVAGMAIGLGGIAFALTAGRHAALRAAAAVAGLLGFFVAYVLIESAAKAVAGEAGPAWFTDEVGILVTGAVMTAAGLFGAQRGAGPRERVRIAS